jgi:hypothetical protein
MTHLYMRKITGSLDIDETSEHFLIWVSVLLAFSSRLLYSEPFRALFYFSLSIPSQWFLPGSGQPFSFTSFSFTGGQQLLLSKHLQPQVLLWWKFRPNQHLLFPTCLDRTGELKYISVWKAQLSLSGFPG